MASVPITLDGALYDLWAKTTQRVVFIGQASLTGLSVGGGPIIPDTPPSQPPGGGPPGQPIHPIWGPPGIELPPGPGFPPVAGHPLPIPPLPPGTTPPNPGDPTTPMPPPAGSAGWPVQPMVPPPYIVVNYPGIGPVIVAPPAQ
jgi:hypothetical protein